MVIDFEPGSEWPSVDVHEDEERYYVLSWEVIEGDRRHGAGSYVGFTPAAATGRGRTPAPACWAST